MSVVDPLRSLAAGVGCVWENREKPRGDISMQLTVSPLKRGITGAYQRLFAGRIARTTFAIRSAILAAVIFILAAPLTTFLTSSSQMLRDVYFVLFLAMLALCGLGFVSAYVKRLHDIGLRGYWALVALIVVPAVIFWGSGAYADYRWRSDNSFNTADVNELAGWIALGLPLLLALWKGDPNENRFGPVPPPVEHFTASKFNIAATAGAAALLIPVSIYAGLFQSGVWVGRGDMAPSMPMIDSNSAGRLLAKCWNIKGVGAGVGDGPLGGVYRDGYGGSVLDFVVSEAGEIDIVPAGETFSKAYRADGFATYSYGLATSEGRVDVGDRSRFLIAAVYDGSRRPNGNVNFTTFSFAKTGKTWPEWQMIMSTGMNLAAEGLLADFEQARGRLMIADCIVR